VRREAGGLPAHTLSPGNTGSLLRGTGIAVEAAGEDASCEGGPGEDSQTLFLADSEEIPLGGAAQEVVLRLQGDELLEAIAAGDLKGLLDLVATEVGDGQVADFAHAHEVVQGGEGLLKGSLSVVGVDLVEQEKKKKKKGSERKKGSEKEERK